MAYRLGIDIGGTFTDATLINESTGEVRVGKVPSTPKDPSIGFLEAVQRMLGQVGLSPLDVTYVVHGTTVATNAIIEGKVAHTGFVTTEGFRDMLEIARQIRPTLYDLQFEKPRPLVPRYLCFGVPERLDARGHVLVPLDRSAMLETAFRLRREGVESVAVCFLHSYVNPAHEVLAGEILHEAFPELLVSLSSDVAPEFREYFRASTTVINASIRPVVSRYLQSIESRLREQGLMVESGPAAGVIAATYLGQALGHPNAISFDMGGTTAKVGLVLEGKPQITKDYEVGSAAHAGVGASRASGYPIRTPVIDLVEIGAGGGSIAWVDSGGGLRVGPQSAGADPGPACYGQGGSEPTITDANLVLGRLNPDYFLGGEMPLDAKAAERAIQEKCASKLGLSVVETAYGIVEIANAAMVNALRLISVQRGYDPRDFVLMAFGGAGPVHANRLAQENEIPTVVIPMSPGTSCAMGLLVTDLKHDYSVTQIRRVDLLDPLEVEAAYQRMEEQGRETLEQEAMTADDMTFLRNVETRYVGQSYELTVPLPRHRLEPADIAQVLGQFHREHDRAYGYSAPGEPVEFVNLRVTAVGRIAKPTLREIGPAKPGAMAAPKIVRSVYFAEAGRYVDCPIYDRYGLAAGNRVVGPAVVEEIDSTTVIHPGYRADVDGFGNLILRRGTDGKR
jgi:N-methylhydantoinase A